MRRTRFKVHTWVALFLAVLLASASRCPASTSGVEDLPVCLDESYDFWKWIMHDARGPARAVRVYRISLGRSFGRTVESKPILLHTREYDDQGNLVRYVNEPNDTSSYRIRFDFDYDDENRVIEQQVWTDGDQIDRTVTDYDERGLKRRKTEYGTNMYGGESVARTTYEYDDEGRLLSWSSKSKPIAELVESTMLYIYNPEGKLVQRHSAKSRAEIGEDTLLERRTYDAMGNLIEKYEPSLLNYRTRYAYDDDGRLVEDVLCDSDGEPIGWLHVYEYNSDGHRVGHDTFNGGGNHDGWIRRSCDVRTDGQPNRGEYLLRQYDPPLRERKPVAGSEVTHRFRYLFEVEYDEFGNWTQYTAFEEVDELGEQVLRPVRIYRRQIKYAE